MVSTAIVSSGAKIEVGDGASPEVFTKIANVTNIGGPDGSGNLIDVTDLSSTKREFLQGISDPGQITVDLMYDPTDTQHKQLRDDAGTNTKRNYKISWSDSPASTATFSALVLNRSLGNALDAAASATFTLQIDGAITFA